MSHIVKGYIKRDGITAGFLIPIYELPQGWGFFHHLNDDKKTIAAFTPYRKEEYAHDENFVPIENGPSCCVGGPAFFVFIHKGQIYTGFCKQKDILYEKLTEVTPTLTNQYLKEEIEKMIA